MGCQRLVDGEKKTLVIFKAIIGIHNTIYNVSIWVNSMYYEV